MSTVKSAQRLLIAPVIRAVIGGKEVMVPDFAENPNRQLIAAWEAEGGVIAPPSPVAPPPREVHAAWFRAALAEASQLDAVEAAVAEATAVERELWAYATTIRIDHPTVMAFAATLSIDLNKVFDRAEKIRAARA